MMKPKVGDVFTAYHEMMGRYFAFQVTKEHDDGYISYLTLDWIGTEPLRADQLSGLKPLYTNFQWHNQHLCLYNVDTTDMPSHYVLVGNIPLVCDQSLDANFYTIWEVPEDHVVCEFRWRNIPEEQRKAYKAAGRSKKKVSFAGEKVPLNKWCLKDDETPFGDMEELRVLPFLSDLILNLWHPGLLEYLRTNPFIDSLSFSVPGCKQLDFRGCHFTKVDIDLTDVEELWLNDEVTMITLSNAEKSHCRIHAKEGGAYITFSFDESFRTYPELTGLRKLNILEVDELDMQSIVEAHPHLRRLYMLGKPGYIRHLSAVSQLRNLEELVIFDMFGFTAEDIPEPEKMENLKLLDMDSVPDDAAKAARKLYGKLARKKLMNLQINRPRKSEWMARHL